MRIKSAWINAALILIPGLLCILITQHYGNIADPSRFDYNCFVISVVLTLGLVFLIAKYYSNDYGDDYAIKIFFIMLFYLIISAVICFVLVFYDFLSGQIVVFYGAHNIMVIILLIFIMVYQN